MSMFVVGQPVLEDFTVTDVNNTLVPGINLSTFTHNLYDSNNNDMSLSIPVTFSELGNGNYRISFIPNSVGQWYLIVYHSTHFPWGKANSIQVWNNSIDNISDLLIRALGLAQENYFLDNAAYNTSGCMTVGRIRTYSNSTSVGTNNDVIAEYYIEASYATDGSLETYKVTKP